MKAKTDEEQEEVELIEKLPVLQIIDARNAEIAHLKRKVDELSNDCRSLYKKVDTVHKDELKKLRMWQIGMTIATILSGIGGYLL